MSEYGQGRGKPAPRVTTAGAEAGGHVGTQVLDRLLSPVTLVR